MFVKTISNSKKLLILLNVAFLITVIFTDVEGVKSPKTQYKKIQQEIKKKKKVYEDIKKKAGSLIEELESLNKSLDEAERKKRLAHKNLSTTNKLLEKIKQEISLHRKKMDMTEREIFSIKQDIENISNELEQQKIWLKQKIIAMQKYGYLSFEMSKRTENSTGSIGEKTYFSDKYSESTSLFKGTSAMPDLLMILVTSEDITQVIRRWKYLKKFAEHEYSLIANYSENLERLKNKEEKLSNLLKNLDDEEKELLKKKKNLASLQERLRGERKSLSEQENILSDKKEEKGKLFASVSKEMDLYRKMLLELEESSKKLLEIIMKSEKKKFVQKGFSSLKGKLSWPVKGALAIPYGNHKDPRFKTPIFRNGIHISSKEGEFVYSVYSGEAVFADWFKGYGKVVIISHGEGYHTVYANLRDIFLSVGDIIKEGETIGGVGESGTLNASGLYFEVRYKGKPLNPLDWLKSEREARKKE